MREEISEVHPDFDFESIAYVPIRRRWAQVGPTVLYAGIEVRRARPDEGERVLEWLRRPGLFRPFGFTQPLTGEQVTRRELPDGSGGVEAVDFLIVEYPASGPVGLVVCYEQRGDGDPDQEVDFGLLQPGAWEGPRAMRTVMIAVLTYLFAVCGARRVRWTRRRPIRRGAPAHACREVRETARSTVYREVGAPFVASVARFRGMLRRARARSAEGVALPLLITAKPETAVQAESSRG